MMYYGFFRDGSCCLRADGPVENDGTFATIIASELDLRDISLDKIKLKGGKIVVVTGMEGAKQ